MERDAYPPVEEDYVSCYKKANNEKTYAYYTSRRDCRVRAVL